MLQKFFLDRSDVMSYRRTSDNESEMSPSVLETIMEMILDVPGAELAVLESLWTTGSATIRELMEQLYPKGSTAHYATADMDQGTIIAQDVTVCGRVKGTIRAARVRLQNGALVEGDIFHKSLSIDESSQFEGSSRRVENPTEPLSSIAATDPQKKDMQTADWKKFGPKGSILTKAECDQAGGRFYPQLFSWMVHVYPFETTPEKIWTH